MISALATMLRIATVNTDREHDRIGVKIEIPDIQFNPAGLSFRTIQEISPEMIADT